MLDAAIACFSREGIAATSLRAIAMQASVTPALLHYYFGDKAQLQQAVVEERLMPAFASLREPLLRAGDDVAALVAAFVRGVGELVARHPWLPSLWVREVLCEGGALRELLLTRVAPQLPHLLAQRFSAAQRAGHLNRDLDPRLLVVSLVGLTLFPAAGAPIWRQFFDADDLDAEAMRAHTMALLEHGIGAG
jgi:AcrR family transcriptional regulator